MCRQGSKLVCGKCLCVAWQHSCLPVWLCKYSFPIHSNKWLNKEIIISCHLLLLNIKGGCPTFVQKQCHAQGRAVARSLEHTSNRITAVLVFSTTALPLMWYCFSWTPSWLMLPNIPFYMLQPLVVFVHWSVNGQRLQTLIMGYNKNWSRPMFIMSCCFDRLRSL